MTGSRLPLSRRISQIFFLLLFLALLVFTSLHSMIGTILRFLLYITNNQARSRHEEIFDMFFWLVETLAVVIGVWILLAKHGSEWIPFLVIEYCWAMDNLRHNRP